MVGLTFGSAGREQGGQLGEESLQLGRFLRTQLRVHSGRRMSPGMSTTMVFFSSMSWMVFSMALSHSWPVALDDQGHTMSSRCRPPRTVHGATYKD